VDAGKPVKFFFDGCCTNSVSIISGPLSSKWRAQRAK
jgi:hypothetical protein